MLLVEWDGGPLATCIAGANVNDHLLMAATLDTIVVERPAPAAEAPQGLCLDAGYDNAASRQVKDAPGDKTHPARPWVVERTFSWLLRRRRLLNRWEKRPQNFLANLKIA